MGAGRIAAYGGGAALLIGGIALVGPRLAQRADELRRTGDSVLTQLTAEPESVPDGALYQRYQLRREAVAAMRADLLKLVALEAAYPADSAHPWRVHAATRYFSAAPGNLGPTVLVTRNGWWAWMSSMHTTITCAVVVGPDTTIGNAPSGTPVCLGESASAPY